MKTSGETRNFSINPWIMWFPNFVGRLILRNENNVSRIERFHAQAKRWEATQFGPTETENLGFHWSNRDS
jgi:hypothetical protein